MHVCAWVLTKWYANEWMNVHTWNQWKTSNRSNRANHQNIVVCIRKFFFLPSIVPLHTFSLSLPFIAFSIVHAINLHIPALPKFFRFSTRQFRTLPMLVRYLLDFNLHVKPKFYVLMWIWRHNEWFDFYLAAATITIVVIHLLFF